MRRRIAAVVMGAIAGFAVVGTGALAGGVAVAADNASISVVHGIPNTPVNVFVNGKLTLRGFQPGKIAGPLSLPAGSYAVKVFPAANTAGTGTPVIAATARVPAGANVTLVAHLTAGGKPTITPFVNDVSKLAAGKARLVVRHTAAAPAVDVRAGGSPVISGLTNPKEKTLTLPAATVKADVVLAGTSTVVIGPADVALQEGTATIVYAIGSATDKTLGLVVQTISGLHSAPAGVPAGTGGRAATGSGPAGSGTPGWLPIAIGAGVLVAAAGATRIATAHR